MLNLDKKFLSRMRGILGDEYEDFISALNRLDEKAIYVNTNKISVDKFLSIIDFNVEKILYEKNGFYIDNVKWGRHPLHHAGAFYIQEPSAMFTVNAYNFKGNELVLDMCASPGGKSIQIANRLPSGYLVSNEIVSARASVLYSNIERMGLKNVIVTNDSPENLANAYANMFDVVLVDAPCSGEGMFRRGDEVVKEWNENLPKMCAKRQLDILLQADKALKQGGVLIYSTCTYSKEENEDVVCEFIKECGYELINIEANFNRGIDMHEVVRLYPHKVRGEGQFVAVMKKISPNELISNSILKLSIHNEANNFIKENLSISLKAYEYKSNAYIPANLELIRRNVNYLSIGVKVGKNKGKFFEPDHYLFSSYGDKFKRQINLEYNSLDSQKYLRGETLIVENENGFCSVLLSKVNTGGGKIVNGIMKNLYPKGLRNYK